MAELLKPDICVIGAGSGGLSVAAAAAAFGVPVVLIERGLMGGDCLNVGCVPSKSLIAAARRARVIADAPDFGLGAQWADYDFAGVRDHVRGVIAEIAPNDSRERFTGLGVRVIEGTARFVDAKTVAVGDAIRIKARRFVIATGSAPALPPIPGLDEVPCLTNETVFDLDVCPEHLVVIGAGPIGLELAQSFRRLGAEVTVLEAEEPLFHEDPECARIVLDQLTREGITVRTGVTVTQVAQVQYETPEAQPDQYEMPLEPPAEVEETPEAPVAEQTQTQVAEPAAEPLEPLEAAYTEGQPLQPERTGEPSNVPVVAESDLVLAVQAQSDPLSQAQSEVMEPQPGAPADEPPVMRAEASEQAQTEAEFAGTQLGSEPLALNTKIQVAISSAAGEAEVIEGTHLLIAAGRRPNVEGLGLEAARIAHGPKGITVDRRLKTTNRRVYAIGDVVGGPQFTHAANYHAGLVIRNALFRLPVRVDETAIPRVTFTDPELAHTGLSEAQARARGHKIWVLRWPYRENDRAQAEREVTGHIKVVTDRRGGILGATIVGANAGELITAWTLAIRQNLNVRAFAGIVVPYPTLSEIGKRASVTYFTQSVTSPWVRRIIAFLRRLG